MLPFAITSTFSPFGILPMIFASFDAAFRILKGSDFVTTFAYVTFFVTFLTVFFTASAAFAAAFAIMRTDSCISRAR